MERTPITLRNSLQIPTRSEFKNETQQMPNFQATPTLPRIFYL